MKCMKILLVTIFIALIIQVPTKIYAKSSPSYLLLGDIVDSKGSLGHDGKATAADARRILQIAVGLERTTYLLGGDMNFNGKIDAADARIALRVTTNTENEPSYYYLSSLSTVYNYIMSSKYYQASNENYGDQCWGMAGVYARAINTCDTTYILNNLKTGNNPTGFYAPSKTSTNKNDILKAVGSELRKNKACILKVASGSYRHYVSVVGYRKGANLSSLEEKDLLIFDVYDGKIKHLGSDRKMLGTGGYEMCPVNDI